MTAVLQIGQTTLEVSELLERLQRYQLLPKLVKEVVIENSIEAIECTPEEAIDGFWKKQQVSPDQRQAWLQQRQMTEAQLLPAAIREGRLAKFKENAWGSQVESYFLQRKDKLDRVLYSLIRTQDASLAQELYFRLQDDEASFSQLARDYSEGQEAQTGGLIGPVELSVPHPVLARMLSVSQPGQLWSPTPIGEWFVIARLDKFLPAQMDEATRQRLLDELFQNWLQQQLQQTAVQSLVSRPESQAEPQPESQAEPQPESQAEPQTASQTASQKASQAES
ncbi:MAG: peptidylprolyl isomerase [Leptolyngbya sp. SIO4C1]|nr:peptidylprolyl isomerase [Leptolyngbya sp. SIO4C1]